MNFLEFQIGDNLIASGLFYMGIIRIIGDKYEKKLTKISFNATTAERILLI